MQLKKCVHQTVTWLGKCVPQPMPTHVETVVLLSHKKADSYIHIDVEFGEGEGKIPVDSMAFHNGSYDKVRRDSIWQRKKMK